MLSHTPRHAGEPHVCLVTHPGMLVSLACGLSHSAMSNSFRPLGLWPTRLLCPWRVSRQEYWSRLPCLPPGDLPSSGIKPRSPALQADSLLPEPPGKPKNTGVGDLSFLQGIFPTQELNQSLLQGRRILYQLSYQRSPVLNQGEQVCKKQAGTLGSSASVLAPGHMSLIATKYKAIIKD